MDRLPVLKWIAAALLIVFLAACTAVGEVPAVGNREPIEAQSVIILTITPELLPASTNQPAPSLAPNTEVASIAQEIEATRVTNRPTEPAQPTEIPVCSPLTIHPLEELPEIISDPYRPPPPGKEQRHHGVDFSYYRRGERLSIQGVGVQTVLPGVVSTSLAETFPYGNLVIIETPYTELPESWVEALQLEPGYSIYTLYAHMERAPEVFQGEELGACQTLGEVGFSGNAVEPHLHIEMRLGAPGESFTSLGFYKADDTEEERSNYLRWRTSGEFQHFDPMLILGGLSSENGLEK